MKNFFVVYNYGNNQVSLAVSATNSSASIVSISKAADCIASFGGAIILMFVTLVM